ncbi:MAG: hypothetical protein B7Z55_01820 [Planctomycetales bacterium 12-60-4]|nr:MAG: hypothetical protein B7Z55_01820 [Planctomycetales bacterium 12-60-4]
MLHRHFRFQGVATMCWLSLLLVLLADNAKPPIDQIELPAGQLGNGNALLPRTPLLSPEDVVNLEASVRANPDDLEARSRLVLFYMRPNPVRDANGRLNLQPPAELEPHVLWLIEHHPELPITGPASMRISRMWPRKQLEQADPEPVAAEVQRLWQSQIDAHRDHAQVLYNAAQFFLQRDRQQALQLFEDVLQLEPDNVPRRVALGHVYLNISLPEPPEVRLAAMKSALQHFEHVIANPMADAAIPGITMTALCGAARAANQIPDDVALKRIAEQMLLPEKAAQPSEYLLAHTLLGLLAVRKDDLPSAREHLHKLATAPQPNRPSISRSPDISLAAELYEKGERDAILEYLRTLRTQDERFAELIEKWISELEDGRRPSFDFFPHVSDTTRNAFLFARFRR